MKEIKPLKDNVKSSPELISQLSAHLDTYNDLMATTAQESIRAAHDANIRAAEFVLNA